MAMSTLLTSSCRLQPMLTSNLLKLATRTSLSQSRQLMVRTKSIQKSSVLQATAVLAAPIRQISTSSVRMSAAGGHHEKLWLFERGLSAVLVALIPAAFLYPSKAGDYLLTATVTVHTYIGLKSVVTDYVRASVLGPIAPPIAQGLLLLITLVTTAGLIQFIRNDVGIANAVQRFWAIKAK